MGDQVPFRFHSEIRSLMILVKSYQILSRTVQDIYRRKRGEVTNLIKICYCWILIRSWPDLPQDCSKIDDGRSWQDLSTTFKIYSRVLQPDQSWEDPRQTSVKIRGRSYKHVPSRILNRILHESGDNQGSGSLQVLWQDPERFSVRSWIHRILADPIKFSLGISRIETRVVHLSLVAVREERNPPSSSPWRAHITQFLSPSLFHFSPHVSSS